MITICQMKQFAFDNYRNYTKLTLLKEKRKERNEMRKAVFSLNEISNHETEKITDEKILKEISLPF